MLLIICDLILKFIVKNDELIFVFKDFIKLRVRKDEL